MTGWEDVRLGDVADTLVGFPFKSAGFTDDSSGVRLLRGVNIGQGFLDWSRTAYWSADDVERYGRFQLLDGDVVLAMDRPWIEAGLKRARVRNGALPALLVQRVTRLRGTEQIRTSFIHHLLASPSFADYIRPIVTGVNVPHISPGQIAAYRFQLPSLREQDAICAVLDSLDDLIENNRRRIALVEQMAQAIYREWFVHFRYPGHEDDELVDSPLGPLPQGWRALPLSGVASIVMGHSPKSEHYNDAREGLPFHQGVANFGARYPHHRLYCRIDGRIAEANDHLVSVRAPVGRINRSDQRIVIGRGLAAVRSKAGLQSLLGHELRRVFREEDAMGGGTIFKAITKGDLEGIPIIQPIAKIGGRAEEILANHDEMIRVLTFGSRALASLRDLLLPKLVSGAIDVSRLDLDAVLDAA